MTLYGAAMFGSLDSGVEVLPVETHHGGATRQPHEHGANQSHYGRREEGIEHGGHHRRSQHRDNDGAEGRPRMPHHQPPTQPTLLLAAHVLRIVSEHG
jgi:hypothetical protein